MDMWQLYNGAPQRRKQEQKGQRNTRVCFQDQFVLRESPAEYVSKEHEQREGAEIVSVP